MCIRDSTDTGKALTVTNNLAVGIYGTNVYFPGSIDDFRVYNTVLTAAQVLQIYSYATDNSYPVIPNVNPIAWYKFDNSSNLGLDSMGTYTATAVTSCLSATGLKGTGALNFNSAGSITVSNTLLNNLPSGTISVWVYLNVLNPNIICTHQHDNVGTYGMLGIGSGYNTANGTAGKIYYGGYGYTLASSTNNLVINNWYLITITFNSSQCLIYINGILDSTTSGNYSIGNNNNGSTWIGYGGQTGNGVIGSPNQQGSFINGSIDDFRLYNVALTAGQVYQLYSGTATIYTLPTVFNPINYTSTSNIVINNNNSFVYFNNSNTPTPLISGSYSLNFNQTPGGTTTVINLSLIHI